MKITFVENIPSNIILQRCYFEYINFAETKVAFMLKNLSRADKKYVLDVLNSINNQDIQDIDFNTFTYVHRDTELGFNSMAKSERLFLVALAADFSKTEWYFNNEIDSLTRKTLKLFLRTFNKSDYVNIAYNEEEDIYYFEKMLREA